MRVKEVRVLIQHKIRGFSGSQVSTKCHLKTLGKRYLRSSVGVRVFVNEYSRGFVANE